MQQLFRLYRHIVKGLQTESVAVAALLPNAGLEWDRNFALQHVSTLSADLIATTAHPWISKKRLLTQHDFPQLARLRPHWDAAQRTLSLWLEDHCLIAADCSTLAGRQRLASVVEEYLAHGAAFERAYHPTMEHVQLLGDAARPQTRYTDANQGPVSVALRASLADMEQRYQHSIDLRRFRINVWLGAARPGTNCNGAVGGSRSAPSHFSSLNRLVAAPISMSIRKLACIASHCSIRWRAGWGTATSASALQS
ncbi:MAG: MOSC N-terminal beta barrel domain-containing protein [Deltaproteobacteria bacterium]|nr:MOSC N-terminal beta barrel domain-containing protein [Deltaproteobacteria bacterium]